MPSLTETCRSLSDVHSLIKKGEPIVIELAVNASSYIDPDKFYLLRTTQSIEDVMHLIELIERETVDNCVVAFFHEKTDQMLSECPAADFQAYFKGL